MALARRAGEMRAAGIELFDLGAGEPGRSSPSCAVEEAVAALRSGRTRYTAVDGLADLRRAVAARYAKLGAPWTGDGDVLITVGAKAALFEAVLALVEGGDEVIVPSPCWSTLTAQVRLAGGRPIEAPMSPDDGFALRAEPILERFGPKTKAVILNSPSNPTGAVIGAEPLDTVVRACAEAGVVLVSDETYSDFVYEEVAHSSVAALAQEFPETVILVSSFSKGYAMTGWRVGFALGHPQVIEAMRTVQSHATSNATTFAMHGAVVALAQATGDLLDHVEQCTRNRETVGRLLSGHRRISYHPPDGAFYAFPRILIDQESVSDFAQRLLERDHVVVVPGKAFGAPEHLRLSFAGDSTDLERGLERLIGALPG